MKTLQDLFEHELKDLYSAEKQLIEAMPKMVEAASDKKLQKAFSDHLKETEDQLKRIESICEKMDIKPTGHKCKAMEGLIKECEGMINEDGDDEVRDAGLIACTQRVEHYEISGYGTAVRYAKELGHDDVAKELQKTLDQEYKADQHLTEMAESRLNRKAKK